MTVLLFGQTDVFHQEKAEKIEMQKEAQKKVDEKRKAERQARLWQNAGRFGGGFDDAKKDGGEANISLEGEDCWVT